MGQRAAGAEGSALARIIPRARSFTREREEGASEREQRDRGEVYIRAKRGGARGCRGRRGIRGRAGASERASEREGLERRAARLGFPLLLRRASRPLRRRRVAVGRWYSFLRDSPDARTRAVARPRAPSPVPPSSRGCCTTANSSAHNFSPGFRNQCAASTALLRGTRPILYCAEGDCRY